MHVNTLAHFLDPEMYFVFFLIDYLSGNVKRQWGVFPPYFMVVSFFFFVVSSLSESSWILAAQSILAAVCRDMLCGCGLCVKCYWVCVFRWEIFCGCGRVCVRQRAGELISTFPSTSCPCNRCFVVILSSVCVKGPCGVAIPTQTHLGTCMVFIFIKWLTLVSITMQIHVIVMIP